MAEKTLPSPGGGITPLQQMLASGTGAILTSLFGEDNREQVGAGGWWGPAGLKDGVISVTPLDVVKIRLQAQRTPFSKGNPAWGRVGVSRQPPPPPPRVSQRAAHVGVSVGRAGGRDFSAPERGAIARWHVTVGPLS